MAFTGKDVERLPTNGASEGLAMVKEEPLDENDPSIKFLAKKFPEAMEPPQSQRPKPGRKSKETKQGKKNKKYDEEDF